MSDRMIAFTSGVNLEGKPFVHVQWGEKLAQLTPEEAIKHGLGVIEVAQGAIADAFLLRWIERTTGHPPGKSWPMLADFREFREARVSQVGKDDPERQPGG